MDGRGGRGEAAAAADDIGVDERGPRCVELMLPQPPIFYHFRDRLNRGIAAENNQKMYKKRALSEVYSVFLKNFGQET